MTDIERPMTVPEAAEYLSVNVFRMRTYLRDGLIKGYKMGSGDRTKNNRMRWRIYREDLDKFLRGNE